MQQQRSISLEQAMQFDGILLLVELLSKLESVPPNPQLSLLTILRSFQPSSSGVDSFSGNHFLSSPMRSNSSFILVYHGTAAIQLHLQDPFLIPVLLLLLPHLQLVPSLESWTPQSHPWGLESTSSKLVFMLIFWPLPMNCECPMNCEWLWEWWILSRRLLIYFPQIRQRNHCVWQWQPYRMYFLNNKTWKSELLLDPWAAEWMLCEQAWRQHESYCTSPSELLGDPGALSMSRNILKEIVYSEVGLHNGGNTQ